MAPPTSTSEGGREGGRESGREGVGEDRRRAWKGRRDD